MIWKALVLAGSRGEADPVARAAGVAHKAFAPVADRPMISHVLETLDACPRVGAITVSIEPTAAPLPAGIPVSRLGAAATPATSVLEAFDRIGPPLLVTTADNPLLTREMLDDFLAGMEGTATDVAAGVAPRAVVEAAGNPARRTYLRFRDADLSGCNLFAFATAGARAAIEFWRSLEADRKRPWRMARKLGPLTLARYLTGSLTSASAADAIGRRAGCTAALIALRHADAAHDVDRPEDLIFAEKRLAERGGALSHRQRSRADLR